MPIYQLDDLCPSIDPEAFIFETAIIIGQVTLKAHTSVWANVVIRADNASITIEQGSNVQEGCVLHVDVNTPLHIHEQVTIGHQAMLHGCTIGTGSLIGMQAIVLNNAIIGKNCIIGAGAIVPEGKIIPDNSLVMGVAKIVRTVNDNDLQKIRQGTQEYIKKAKSYSHHLKRLD